MHLRQLLSTFRRLRLRLMRTGLSEGDLVELTTDVRYRERLDANHLASCPAGTRGLITAIGATRQGGGVLLCLVDEDGTPTRYWTGADVREVRRLAA